MEESHLHTRNMCNGLLLEHEIDFNCIRPPEWWGVFVIAASVPLIHCPSPLCADIDSTVILHVLQAGTVSHKFLYPS